MNLYLSTYISGLEQIVATRLVAEVPDCTIKKISDGFVLYSSSASYSVIRSLTWLHNSFVVIKIISGIGETTKSINHTLRKILHDDNVWYHVSRKIPPDAKTFRVVLVRENTMVPSDINMVRKLEEKIQSQTHIYVHKTLPDIEFWFYIRREGEGYWTIRLTKHEERAKSLQRGELRPELANMLCFLAQPEKKDIVCDPCAGSGAIPDAWIQNFSYYHMFVGDQDVSCIETLKKRFTNQTALDIEEIDILKLQKKDRGITKIVTDPPWGKAAGKEIDELFFYTKFFHSCNEILSAHGMMVLLLSRDIDIQKYNKTFYIEHRYNILVSGQKATIYVLSKIG